MNTKIDYPNGDIYIGDVDENGLPHGKGVKRYKQQSYGKWLGYQVCYKEYKGDWVHGVKSGKGEMDCYKNGHGTIKYSGNWERDLPNGKGKATHYGGVTNMTYVGEFKDGLRHGFGKFTESWDKGTFPPVKYEGEWREDVRCGKGICMYGNNDENVYDGDWLNNMRDGHGVWIYENGDKVECEWKCGNKNGKGVYTFANGTSFHAEWHDNEIQMDTVKKSELLKPIMNLSVFKSGLDYNKRASCLMEAEVDEYIMANKIIVKCDKGSREIPILTITSVDDEKMSYVVSSDYVEGNSSVVDTIYSGEKKKYSCCIECTARIYDDEYDYTIEREIIIEYK